MVVECADRTGVIGGCWASFRWNTPTCPHRPKLPSSCRWRLGEFSMDSSRNASLKTTSVGGALQRGGVLSTFVQPGTAPTDATPSAAAPSGAVRPVADPSPVVSSACTGSSGPAARVRELIREVVSLPVRAGELARVGGPGNNGGVGAAGAASTTGPSSAVSAASAAGVGAIGASDAVGADGSAGGGDGAELIDLVAALEELKSAIAGAQARAAVAFDVVQRRAQAAGGVPASEQGRGVAAQLALARRESPARGSRLLGLARALVLEMPHPSPPWRRVD